MMNRTPVNPTTVNRVQQPAARDTNRQELLDYPVSLQQEGVWLQASLEPGNPVWNISHSWRWQGSLNVDALKQAIRELIRRQNILGIRFFLVKEKIRQRFDENFHIDSFFKFFDLSGYPRDEKETAARSIEKKEAMRPYDLAAGPLIRFTLIRLAPLDHVLVISKHHIISDVTSRQILWRELVTLYNAFAFGTPHQLEPLEMQYYDYAVWQQEFMESDNYQQQKAYWLTQLPGPLPLLELPTDYPRKDPPPRKISFVHMNLDPGLAVSLRNFGLRRRVIFSAIFLLAFYILLEKYSGQKDILIGTMFGGRNPDRKKLKKIIGLFVNHLPVRLNRAEVNHGDDITIIELLDLVNKKTREAYNNQDFLFEDLTRILHPQRSSKHAPLFRVVFNMLKVPEAKVELQGLKRWHPLFSTYYASEGAEATVKKKVDQKTGYQEGLMKGEWQRFEPDTNISSQYDLSLYVRDEFNNIDVKLLYPRYLFKRETIKRMLGQYHNILLEIAAQPTKKLRQLQIITAEEKRRIIDYFNDTHKAYPLDKTVHGLFEEQVERTPFHAALVAAETGQGVKPSHVPARNINAHVSYKELNQRANQLARLLREKGVGPDTVVGIMTARCAEMVVGLYGIMKAGGACLLLDPGLPSQRLNYMIQDNSTSFLISQPHLLHETGIKPGNLEVIDVFDPFIYRHEVPVSKPETVNRSGDLAYIIYTSGSTGRPKGIMIEHRSLHRCIDGTVETIDFSPGKIILSLSPITFDIFVLEIYLPLSRGLRVVMADEELQRDSSQAAVLLVTHLVEMIQTPLTRMQLLTQQGCNWERLEGVKEIIIGGEVFPEKLLEGLKRLPLAKIYNMYGPSETTVWATIKDITLAETIDLGKPLVNNRIYILDKYLNLQPVGVIGEICIAGDGLARGYLNNPELTREKFCLRRPGGSFCKNRPLDPHKNFLLKAPGKKVFNDEEKKNAIKKYNKKLLRGGLNQWVSGSVGQLDDRQAQSGNPLINPLIMMPRPHPGTNENQHQRVAQHIGSPRRGAPGRRRQRNYRTGDLGRWLWDGNIQFFGRIDQQVKVRGHRIELGEIETLLDRHPAVQNSVVTVREFQPGDHRLVAYINKCGKENQRKLSHILRQYLCTLLPDYMVPAAFVVIDAFPLTSSGKIDRQQLPDPCLESPEPDNLYVPPRDELECQLTSIWEKVLKVKPIGLTDDFFKLGGYSLLVVQLFSRIKKELGCSLPAAVLFTATTVEQLAAVIRQRGDSPGSSVIIPLQTGGSGIPVFLMHHADGGVIDYQELVQQMGKEHPVYGLHPPRSLGNRLLQHNIKEIAAYYVEEIRKFHPAGPCIIGGHSFGGWVAFEVACRLKILGQEVDLLVLMDTRAPGCQLLPLIQRIEFIVFSYIEKIKFHTRRLLSIPPNQRWKYFLVKSHVVLERVRRLMKYMYRKVIKRLKRAAIKSSTPSPHTAYVPGLYPGRAVLFKSAVPLPVDDQKTYGWKRYITGSLEVYNVPGEHGNLTKAPHVRVLADKLNSCIRASG
jgi:amino acid adenylation domain-containing protein